MPWWPDLTGFGRSTHLERFLSSSTRWFWQLPILVSFRVNWLVCQCSLLCQSVVNAMHTLCQWDISAWQSFVNSLYISCFANYTYVQRYFQITDILILWIDILIIQCYKRVFWYCNIMKWHSIWYYYFVEWYFDFATCEVILWYCDIARAKWSTNLWSPVSGLKRCYQASLSSLPSS